MFLEYIEDKLDKHLYRFLSTKGDKKILNSSESKIEYVDFEDFHCKKSSISFNDGVIYRVFVNCGKTVGILLEYATLREPQCFYSSFEVPIRKNIVCNLVDKNRIVFRIDDCGAKIFRIVSKTDGQDCLEKSGLLFPDGFLERDFFNITPYTGLHKYGKNQLNIFTILESSSQDVPYLHVKEDENCFVVSGKNGIQYYKFFTKEEELIIKSFKTNKSISINITN